MIIITGTTVFGQSGAEYEVLDYIASGSFGTVYKAKERQTGKMFALKTLSTPFAQPEDLKSFINEANLAVGIRHAHVIQYFYFHDGETYNGLPPYILMEYADEGTLADVIAGAKKKQEHFSQETLIGMFTQLASGMKAVNETLVHRDIKPANILISSGVLKITDFGLAKVIADATRTFTFKGGGTLPYIAPEGWRMERNTLQLDIYSMGVVFYELATHRLPVSAASADPHKWMEAHLFNPVVSPEKINSSIDPRLSQVIMKMLEKSTAKRFSDWSTIVEQLAHLKDFSSQGNTVVSEMLNRRLEQDTQAQAAAAEAARKTKEVSDFCRLVLAQAYQAVIVPIGSLIDDFNREYVGTKAKFAEVAPNGSTTSCALILPSGNRVHVAFRPFLDQDFVRKFERRDYGRSGTFEKVAVPRVQEKRIQCWGTLKAIDGRGFNFALLEQSGEIYGEWVMLLNRMGFPANVTQRPEPFPFEEDEFEKELQLLGAIHIYSTDIRPLDSGYVSKFIADYI